MLHVLNLNEEAIRKAMREKERTFYAWLLLTFPVKCQMFWMVFHYKVKWPKSLMISHIELTVILDNAQTHTLIRYIQAQFSVTT